jgi:hypothetical protein
MCMEYIVSLTFDLSLSTYTYVKGYCILFISVVFVEMVYVLIFAKLKGRNPVSVHQVILELVPCFLIYWHLGIVYFFVLR